MTEKFALSCPKCGHVLMVTAVGVDSNEGPRSENSDYRRGIKMSNNKIRYQDPWTCPDCGFRSQTSKGLQRCGIGPSRWRRIISRYGAKP